MEASERNATRVYLGWAHASYAELFREKGDPSSAREHLGKAIDILRQCGADGWMKKYERELAELQ